jgi:hypothetical protein
MVYVWLRKLSDLVHPANSHGQKWQRWELRGASASAGHVPAATGGDKPFPLALATSDKCVLAQALHCAFAAQRRHAVAMSDEGGMEGGPGGNDGTICPHQTGMNAGAVWISTRRRTPSPEAIRHGVPAPRRSDPIAGGGPSSQVGITVGHEESRTTPGRAMPLHASPCMCARWSARGLRSGCVAAHARGRTARAEGEGVDEW